MKKPGPIEGDFIPAIKASKKQNIASDGIDFNQVLSKLSGNQLTEITNSIFETGNNFLSLQREKNRTQQIAIESHTAIETAKMELMKVKEGEITRRKEIDQQTKKNAQDHKVDMEYEMNRHAQIMKILKMIEQGKISSGELAMLINQTNTRNNQ